MTTKPRVTDRSWLSGSEWTWARFLRWAVLVAATLVVTAPSPAQDGTYDPAPLAALEDQGVDAVPGGLPLETGGDVQEDAGAADDPNADGEPPGPPTKPAPAHGETGVPRYTGLYWRPAPRADSYDVYFGTDNPPPYVGNTSYWCWWPSEVLDFDTTYYWQIVAKNASGSTPGPVWWFHTIKSVECRGDLNCDDFIDFGDINVYVLAFANWPAWRQQYPDCPPENAYIEINEFATRLASAGGQPIPCSPSAGACRLANGPCELKTEAECTAASGVWQGAGTVCTPDADGEPPAEPSNPDPPHGATGVSVETNLGWREAPRADSYDVYFGADNPPPYVGRTFSAWWLTYATLHRDTTYYWQIVARNASGSTPGPVWSFHTTVVCRGDTNCDGFIDFGDINAFVLALSNWQAWLLKYPDCPPENNDINGDKIFGGVVGGSNDIKAFVELLASAGGQPIPCE